MTMTGDQLAHMDPDAILQMSRALRESEQTAHILKKKGGSLEPIKEELRMARKDTMRTVQHFLCDQCDQPISKPELGYVIHGNVYVADPNALGGLIGNNFPDKEQFTGDEVKKTVLCRGRLLKALGIEQVHTRNEKNLKKKF